jgi:hypothetical protein
MGPFTKALFGGVCKARQIGFGKGAITVKTLDAYIAYRVQGRLTQGQQAPTCSVSTKTCPIFPISY